MSVTGRRLHVSNELYCEMDVLFCITHTHTHRVVYGEEIFPDPCTFENEFGFLLCWLVDCLVVHIFPVLVWEIHSTCYQSASVRAVSSLQ